MHGREYVQRYDMVYGEIVRGYGYGYGFGLKKYRLNHKITYFGGKNLHLLQYVGRFSTLFAHFGAFLRFNRYVFNR